MAAEETEEKPRKNYPRVSLASELGLTESEYRKYVREHNRKLRRLQEVQDGWNMERPEQ